MGLTSCTGCCRLEQMSKLGMISVPVSSGTLKDFDSHKGRGMQGGCYCKPDLTNSGRYMGGQR